MNRWMFTVSCRRHRSLKTSPLSLDKITIYVCCLSFVSSSEKKGRPQNTHRHSASPDMFRVPTSSLPPSTSCVKTLISQSTGSHVCDEGVILNGFSKRANVCVHYAVWCRWSASGRCSALWSSLIDTHMWVDGECVLVKERERWGGKTQVYAEKAKRSTCWLHVAF